MAINDTRAASLIIIRHFVNIDRSMFFVAGVNLISFLTVTSQQNVVGCREALIGVLHMRHSFHY